MAAYQPAFTEVFLGLLVAIGWAWWLERKGVTLARTLALASAVIAGLGQVVAFALVATADFEVATDARLAAARWIPFGAVVATLVVEGVLTVRGRRRSP
jgi:hypothetical protein